MMMPSNTIPPLLANPLIKVDQTSGGGTAEKRQYSFQVTNNGGSLYSVDLKFDGESSIEASQLLRGSRISVIYNVISRPNPLIITLRVNGIDGNGQQYSKNILLQFINHKYETI